MERPNRNNQPRRQTPIRRRPNETPEQRERREKMMNALVCAIKAGLDYLKSKNKNILDADVIE